MSTPAFLAHIPRHVPPHFDTVAITEDPWGQSDAPAVVLPLTNEALLPVVESLVSSTLDGRRLSVVSVRDALLSACISGTEREAA